MKHLEGKRIALTGGTEGIGLAMAESLIQQGASVVTCGLKDPSPDLLAAYAGNPDFHIMQTDLSRPENAKDFVQQAFSRLGGLDHLINNAGTFQDVPFLDIGPEQFHKTFDLNVGGYFFCSQEFVRLVGSGNQEASIICVGSTNSIQAEEGSVLYDSSKGAVLMLVRSMAVELAPRGIRVNGIAPGIIETPLSAPGLTDATTRRCIEHQIPLGRIGVPRDVGGTAVYLCSDLAGYVTGQMIYVDGGVSALQMKRTPCPA
jgi:NAD(P)-dependent dehydrogenase (short-subunit alcohol dehydrogenase family)